MEDLDAEDDGYSDEDLDALPDNAFHELQESAVRSTQQPSTRAQLCLADLSRPGRAGVAGGHGQILSGGTLNKSPVRRAPLQPSSDYGDFDDEMLDGEIVDAAEQPVLAAQYEAQLEEGPLGESTQSEQWRQQRYAHPQPCVSIERQRQPEKQNTARSVAHTKTRASSVHRPIVVENPSGKDPLTDHQSHDVAFQLPLQRPADVDALQTQVEKLLREREVLQQNLQNANDMAYAKAGEIAIVRANASKVEKEYENRTMSLQKLHADEASRQKIEVEKARAELQKIATEKDFLENDLAEGTKQIRNLQKAIKKGSEKATGKENLLATPKKGRGLQLREDFDDAEVQPMSPSKLALRSKANIPKAGAKRRRKAPKDSPVKPLELSLPKRAESSEGVNQDQSNAAPTPAVQTPVRLDKRFQLTQKLLNHRFEPDEPRTFERLAGFAFPSQTDKPLSTILLDEMSTLTYSSNAENFPSAISLIIIAMWSRCMEEEYHQPVHLLVDFVKYILELNPIKTAPDLANDLMSLVQSTADIILIPRCQKKPPRKDKAHISSTTCLEIIYLMAYDCQPSNPEITRFWRTLRFDFIMMLLNFINPLPEIHLMLSLLHTSILPSSFAMIIPPDNGNQDASEAHIIDNLSHLLINTPRAAPQGEPGPPDAVQLCTLRIEVLNLFEAMLDTAYSAEALARHRLAIGCLVRIMNDELNAIYDYTSGHELRIMLVNQSTRLLYQLITTYPHLINMQAKLSVVPGGEKKFLIALTRLAFSEGGFYEGGIRDDVVDCAHQMLEARVSPEEAEGLIEAFSSAPVSRK